jgi:uncharacterized membrane protein
VLFLILTVNCVISFVPSVLGKLNRYAGRIRNTLLVATLVIVLGGVSITAMVDRARTAPVYGVHDIILQQEAAMRYVITGKNPYKETYFGTPMEAFHYAEPGNDTAVNPALYHFVMPPWYLVFPFAFYYTVRPVVGFFDGRMALLFTMAALLVALWYWFKDKGVARLAIILTALSPAVIDYFIEGRSDVFALSWLVVSLVLLERKRFVWSAGFIALAFLSKQTTWVILPFYGLALWRATAKRPSIFWRSTLAAVGIVLVITLPFFLWDPRAFLDSVIFYLNGTSSHSYPVSGYGLSMVLYAAGFIRDIHAYYPFVMWQVLLGGPVFVLLMRSLWMTPKQSRLMLSYAVFLMVFWYMSRYFNNSHLGYLSMLFVLAGLKGMDEGMI